MRIAAVVGAWWWWWGEWCEGAAVGRFQAWWSEEEYRHSGDVGDDCRL